MLFVYLGMKHRPVFLSSDNSSIHSLKSALSDTNFGDHGPETCHNNMFL